MDIICYDRSRGKLIYALEFLSYLNTASYKTGFALSAEQASYYKSLFRFLPNITVSDKATADRKALHLVFSEVPRRDEELRPHLIFPVTSHEKKGEWEALTAENTIPLGETNNLRQSVFTADYLSACDMLERRLGDVPLRNKRLIVSAGPTAEDIDPVRFITNRSTGKMGIAVARAAYRMGAEVLLILGPSSEAVPFCLKTKRVRSAAEMAEAVISAFPRYDAYIAAAAVADFTPAKTAEHKIKKSEAGLTLHLTRTPDILEGLKERRPGQMVAGFSMETENLLQNSLLKLRRKKLDWIVANNPTEQGAGFAADTNKVVLIGKQGQELELPKASKMKVAEQLLQIIFRLK